MRFRIKHLQAATLVVALFAAAFAFPTFNTIAWLNLGMVAATIGLVVRAVCVSGKERKVIMCGLFGAASYLIAEHYWQLPFSGILWKLRPKLPAQSSLKGDALHVFTSSAKVAGDNIVAIGHRANAVMIGVTAALLASHWSRKTDKSDGTLTFPLS